MKLIKIMKRCVPDSAKVFFSRKLLEWHSFFDKDCNRLYYKKESCTQGTYRLCVFVNNTYNFVDAVLPVLSWMKENSECYVLLVFFIPTAEADYIQSSQNQFMELISCCHSIILYQEAKYSSDWEKYIAKMRLRYILDYVASNERPNTILTSKDVFGGYLRPEFLNKGFSQTLLVTMEIGNFLGEPVSNYDYSPLFIDHAIIPNQGAYEKSYPSIKNINIIRSARLDSWWRKKENYKAQAQKDEILQGLRYSYVIICAFTAFGEGPNAGISDKEKKMFMNALELLQDKYSFIFKFHPRTFRKERDEFIHKWIPCGLDWKESNVSMAQLAVVGDVFAIIGRSTSVTDVLLADIPVISFFDKFDLTMVPETCFNTENGVESFAEHHDLVLHANNASEFCDLIHKALFDNCWDAYKGRFEKFLPSNKNSCKEIADILLRQSV